MFHGYSRIPPKLKKDYGTGHFPIPWVELIMKSTKIVFLKHVWVCLIGSKVYVVTLFNKTAQWTNQCPKHLDGLVQMLSYDYMFVYLCSKTPKKKLGYGRQPDQISGGWRFGHMAETANRSGLTHGTQFFLGDLGHKYTNILSYEVIWTSPSRCFGHEIVHWVVLLNKVTT